MEVRPGYKHTEVGVIPEDWAVMPLDSFCEISAGRDLVKEDFSPTPDHRHEFPIYSNALTDGGLYGYSKSYQYGPDKITVTARGDVGNAVYRSTPFCAIGRLLVLSSTHPTDLRFVTEFINQFVEFALESTGVPQLTAPQISKYMVALPPTKMEQEAIAEALSDTDALIQYLEQLIAKKRQLKQGAMQELLTGKRRLPGFSGAWQVKRLGDVCRITTGKKDVNEGNPDGQFHFFTCSRSHTYSDSYSFDTEAILIAGNGDVGNLHYYKGKFEAYQRTYVLSEFSANVNYLWQQLSAYLAEALGLRKIGSSIPYIKKENLIDFAFDSPGDENEQIAIAVILSDMDAEIAALESKLAKASQIKQGMMQELLTGRIRLV